MNVDHLIKNQYQIIYTIDGIPSGLKTAYSKNGNSYPRYGIGFPLGSLEKTRIVFNHVEMLIKYKKHKDRYVIQVFEVKPTSIDWVDACKSRRDGYKTGKDIQWTYSVAWIHDSTYQNRWDYYEHEYNVETSFMGAVIVLLVFNIIGYVLFRNVEIKERVQYAQEQPPRQYGLFTALVGSGVHLSVSLILLLLISLFGVYHSTTESGHAFRFLYNVTSYIQGFISTKLYCTYYRIKWIRHAVYTHFLVPMIVTGFLIARNLGLLFTDNDFITLTTNDVFVCIVTLPMTILGSCIGKNVTKRFYQDHQYSKELPWYLHPLEKLLLSGIPPFLVLLQCDWLLDPLKPFQVPIVEYTLLCLIILVTHFQVSLAMTITTMKYTHSWFWNCFLGPLGMSLYFSMYVMYHCDVYTSLGWNLFGVGFMLVSGSLNYYGTQKFLCFMQFQRINV